MNDPIVGIDLGTSNTVVAHTGATGAAQVLADGQGFKIHPSVVSFHPTGGVVVGAAAKQRKVIDPKNTIYSVKRLIGRSFSSHEVQTARQRMPYQIKEGANQLPLIVSRAGDFAVPEISAIVLDHAKNIATTALATPITRAVVTVPASFNDAQRSATATAGSIAGLDVVRVLNEPTAAALAYGATRNLREIIAVYDFGGGTFDITILKLADQVYEVLGTSGDTFLGGDDLDERLVDRMVEKFLMENRVDLRQNEVSMMRLRAVAEQVKIELSRRSRAMVRVDEIAYGPKGKPLDLQIEIKRDEFVRQCADIIDRTFPVCEEALKYANLTIDHIDDVVLVGGTTKIPYVRDQVAKFFAKAPRTDVNPEDAVALGAGLQAGALERASAPARSTVRGVAPAFDENESTFGGDSTGGTETFSRNPPEATNPEATNPEPTLPADPAGPGRRAATRGDHHDVFEDRTPTPVPPGTPVIGRMTKDFKPPPGKPGIKQTQALPIARPPAPPSSRPRPGASVQIPPPSPASTLRGVAPVHDEDDDFPDPKTKRDDRMFEHIGTETGIADLDPLGFPSLATDQDLVNPASTAKGFAPPTSAPPTSSAPAPPPARAAAPPPAPPAAARGAGPTTTSQLPLQPPTPPRAQASTPSRAHATAPTVIVEPQSVPVTAPDAKTLIGAQSPAHIGAQSPTLIASRPDPAPASRDSQMPTFVANEPAPARVQPAPAYVPASSAAPAPPSPVVVDVTPRGLGIGTVAGYCEELIRRNSRVPTETRKLFTTSRDGQDAVRIIVCQGESRKLANNTVIGDLVLEGLPPRPRGETSIEVTFALDANGILQVRARDAETGREQRASLDIVGTIQQQDIDAAREKLQALRR